MGDKLMDASILLSFNKLKTIVKRAGLSGEDAQALVRRETPTWRMALPRSRSVV